MEEGFLLAAFAGEQVRRLDAVGCPATGQTL
jgi:hypothetical protein